ncbi:beta-ketoacyl synthase chain length factor [Bombella mellum]|uniref:Beta-ketoacyl synthase-like N-terminal domain-containing protein n=1 Tax=Bombella mellum TaxID=2039288 RepID=A0ABR5ZUE2_9PROT|nr:beta-ketoacyl synthase chain length factor [Bombella mellum]MBA5727927.1 hypothetical protein [Bombella mellum]
MIISIKGIGCWGDGLHGWTETAAILRGDATHSPDSLKLPPPASLPANERRRASQIIRLAVLCAEEACQQGGFQAVNLPAVFASSNGDGFIMNRILDSLSTPDGAVSPSLFHNSVHNAPAGYWMIGHKSHQPAVSLGLHDETLAASLLKAAAEAHVEASPVLFCLYDAPMPGSLGSARHTEHSFGCAFILTPGHESGIRLALSLKEGPCETDLPPSLPEGVTGIARHNPAGQVLPLLQAIARRQDRSFSLPYGANHVTIDLTHAHP